MKILIVDDNSDLRTIYEGLFEGAGHDVHSAGDGLAAMKEVDTFMPDLVLLDILMPEMDGLGFMRTMQERTEPKPLLIAHSNLSEQVDVDRSLAAGAYAYLRKADYNGQKLVDEVERLYKKWKG